MPHTIAISRALFRYRFPFPNNDNNNNSSCFGSPE